MLIELSKWFEDDLRWILIAMVVSVGLSFWNQH